MYCRSSLVMTASEARAARTPFPIGGAPVWADTTLRDTLAAALSEGGLPLVDLTPALTDPGSFLEKDFHLSVGGHAAVAERLAATTAEGQPSKVK